MYGPQLGSIQYRRNPALGQSFFRDRRPLAGAGYALEGAERETKRSRSQR